MFKKITGIICTVLIITSLAVVSVSACIRGYGSAEVKIKEAFWFWETDKATATMTRCSCTPVDNDLMTWLQVQYKSGNNYYWMPGDTTYYYDHDTNVDEVSVTITQDGINYAHAIFFAKCGDNSTNRFELVDAS